MLRATPAATSGEGNNCLFRVLAHAHSPSNVSREAVMKLRRDVTDNILKRHKADPLAPMNPPVEETFEEAIKLEAGVSVEKYCDMLRASTRTGGDVAIASFVNLYPKIRIVTCVRPGGPTRQGRRGSQPSGAEEVF
jgi:hypothetical protein